MGRGQTVAAFAAILFFAAAACAVASSADKLDMPPVPEAAAAQHAGAAKNKGDFMEVPKPVSSKIPADLADFSWYHGVGIVLACVGLVLAAGGGIGGGGILVPIYIIVMHFSTKWAVPLSNITILGGAIANNAFNLQKRHPNPSVSRPMIDYDLVLLMEPPTIAGAVLGSILNKVMPEWLITGLLVIVLGMTATRTYQTGQKKLKKEQDAEAAAQGKGDEAQPLTGQYTAVPPGPPEDQEQGGGGGSGSGQVTESAGDESETLKAIIADEADPYPVWKIGAIGATFVAVVICNLIKLHATHCGGPMYWILMLFPVFLTGSIMLIVRNYLLNVGVSKRSCGYVKVQGDFDWDETTTITYPLICTLAGVFAGMFGIGGGIVKGPLMLEMGVLPEVSSATAAFMIFFTAASATVTYASFQQVKWDFGFLLFGLGIIFTAVGQKVVNDYISRTGRSSLIIFIIAGIVGLSTLLMGYESSLIAYHDIVSGKGGFGSVCKISK